MPVFTPDAQDSLRQTMDADIVVVGFGPAAAGFLHTLGKGLVREDGTPVAESRVMPGMPPQVICYERADDLAFGVSGVVTRARAIRQSLPDFDPALVPMAAPVSSEEVAYLLDPHGASRRSPAQKLADKMLQGLGSKVGLKDDAVILPYIPPALRKHDGFVLSLGQFMQWVAGEIMGSGMVQVWPGTPVAGPLMDGEHVLGVRLVDQGVDAKGNPDAAYMPGMDVRAALTVVADGPVGPVGRALDQRFGLPEGHEKREWAVGMKAVVDLPPDCGLAPGTVLHTLGYPEPEIFGFLYVYPDNVASLGIFVPSWFDNPNRTAYRYLQHWMRHPYLWKHLNGATLRSWGAKSLFESGRRGEPFLVGDGYARIGEGSGTTNVLTGSGVDEAWASGVQLAEGVLELLAQGRDFSGDNLQAAYVARRRASWLDEESKVAEKSRDGFQQGFLRGLVGMAVTDASRGKLAWPGFSLPTWQRIPKLEAYYRGMLTPEELETLRRERRAAGQSLHDPLMRAQGWPEIELDGKLLVTQQDALLMGGKVQAAPGYADHVRFVDPALCRECAEKTCIEACSGQAITANPEGEVPLFDREKCVHCGACLWNCTRPHPVDPERTNIEFGAGSGGLHSAEN